MVKSVINKSEIIYVLISSKYDLYIKSAENTNKVPEEEALEFTSKNNILFAHLSIAEKYSNGINLISLLNINMIYSKYYNV